MTAQARGRWRRGAILAVPLLLASCQGLRGYDSQARTIKLHEGPISATCIRGGAPAACVVLMREDWEALVIDYKAKCLQLGGSPHNCQTEQSKP